MSNFNEILQNIKRKSFAPVYFLQGEEPYFIDKISDAIQKNVLKEHERDFNQAVFYGKEVEVDDIVSSCKRFPMMSEKQVIFVKEAQNLGSKIDAFKAYFEQPTPTTVLVICHKHKTIRSNSKLLNALGKNGVVFKSDKIKDYKLPDWILNHVKEHKLQVSPKEAIMLSDFLGNDLEKINHEIEKLKIILKGETTITSELIEKHIGISKEYNLFELSSALAVKNQEKITRISNYAQNNTKNFPIPLMVGFLYGYFSKIMKLHFSKNKTNEAVLAKELKIHPFILKEYKKAAQNYPPKKISTIISLIKKADLQSKGIGVSHINEAEIIKELLFKIAH